MAKAKTSTKTMRTAGGAKQEASKGEGTRGAVSSRWTEAASKASVTPTWNVPWFVLMQEAADASAFVDARWKNTGDGKKKPIVLGLESVAKQLPATVAAEIRELQGVAQAAHEEYLLRTRPAGKEDVRSRADHVLGEITAALEFLFDDGVEDERDGQLATVQGAHDDAGSSNAAVASALEDYGALAAAHRDELDGLGGFDPALIDEVGALATALRAPPSAGAVERSPEAIEAIERRNRHANLLHDRIKQVRRAAQFVFRQRPTVVREVTSTYLRRKQAAARRAKKQK
jgi:hypothetical protein